LVDAHAVSTQTIPATQNPHSAKNGMDQAENEQYLGNVWLFRYIYIMPVILLLTHYLRSESGPASKPRMADGFGLADGGGWSTLAA
jgi:hypothetical protein